MRKIHVVLWVLVLSALDQLIKVIVDLRFLETTFEIIPGLIEFKPKYNMHYFYFNEVWDLGLTFWPSILFIIIIGVFIFLIYRVYKHCSHYKKLIDWWFIFMFSGLICAFLSNTLWKGVLDYIYLKPLFIFDLKDLYIQIGAILFLIGLIKDAKDGIVVKWKNIKEFYSVKDKKRFDNSNL